MAVSIRSLAPDEWRTYRAVRLAALQDAPDAFGGSYEASAAYPDHQWIEWCGQPSWFAFDDRGPVGMVRAFRPDDESLPELVSMWVAPRSRGGDTARRLVSEVLDWAAAEGMPGVCLCVIADNVRAKRLYKHLGFAPNGISHHLPDGRSEIEMEHRFPTTTRQPS